MFESDVCSMMARSSWIYNVRVSSSNGELGKGLVG